MYCPSCGASNVEYGAFCISCGRLLPAKSAAQSSAAPTIVHGRDAYAGFWRRLAAYAIDYVVIAAAAGVLGAVLSPFVSSSLDGEPENDFLSVMAFALVYLYSALMQSSALQATLGKLAVGIKVQDLNGERISFARASGRFFAQLVTGILMLGIGYLFVVFTSRRQGLHDLVAGTVVQHRHGRPVATWVVAVGLLVAFVPLIGILAAIALPAYQDYTIRAQVSEGLNLATPHKAAVAAAWESSGRNFENIYSGSIDAAFQRQGKYVESVDIVSGAIVITYGGEANATLSGRTLTIVPALDAGAQSVAWQCGRGAAPEGFEAIFEDPGRLTDVPNGYLPSACRGF